MVVLEGVPLGRVRQLEVCVNHHAVLVVNVPVPVVIARAHELLHLCDELRTRILYGVDSRLVYGWVTDALEELDALLTLHFLKVPVLLNEVLLHHPHILTHLLIGSLGHEDIFSLGSPHVQGVSVHGLDRVGLCLGEVIIRQLLQADARP